MIWLGLLVSAPVARANVVKLSDSGYAPHVFVDDAGTAHIVWTDYIVPGEIHYCRLKRAATACDASVTLDPRSPLAPSIKTQQQIDAPSGNSGTEGPAVYGGGGGLVILDQRAGEDPNTGNEIRFPAAENETTTDTDLEYTSNNGGGAFDGPGFVGSFISLANPSVTVGPPEDRVRAFAGLSLASSDESAPQGVFVSEFEPGGFANPFSGADFGQDSSYGRLSSRGLVTDGKTALADLEAEPLDGPGQTELIRAWSGNGDIGDISNWGKPVALPGRSYGASLVGGPGGYYSFNKYEPGEPEGDYYVHKITGSTVGPGHLVFREGDFDAGLQATTRPRFVEAADGALIALVSDDHNLEVVSSTDGGLTWPAAATDVIPNPKSVVTDEVEASAAADGGGFAVTLEKPNNDDETGVVVAGSFGPQSPTGKPGLGGLPGGGVAGGGGTGATGPTGGDGGAGAPPVDGSAPPDQPGGDTTPAPTGDDNGDGNPSGSGTDPSGASGCLGVHFGDVKIKPYRDVGCISPGDGKYEGFHTSKGEVDINGLRVVPDKLNTHQASRTLINDSTHEITSDGAVTVSVEHEGVGPVVLFHGELKSHTDGDTEDPSGTHPLFSWPAEGVNVEGFPILGQIPVLVGKGAKTSITVSLQLPSGFGGTASVTLRSGVGDGLAIPSLKIPAFSAGFGPISFGGISLAYHPGNDTWTGTGTVDLSSPFGVTLQAVVTFGRHKTDTMHFIGGELTAHGFPGIALPLPDTFLTAVRFHLQTEGRNAVGQNCLCIGGGATVGAIQGLGQYVLRVDGDVGLSFGGSFGITVTGTGKLLNEIDLGSASVQYDSNKGFSASFKSGDIGECDAYCAYVAGKFAIGTVDNAARWGAHLEIGGCVLDLICKNSILSLDVNDVGFCLNVLTGHLSNVWAIHPGGAKFSHCGTSKFGPPVIFASRDAGASQPLAFAVAAGVPTEYVEVAGQGGAPDVAITGPDGQPVAVTSQPSADESTTYVEIDAPQAGLYHVVPADGSVPVSSLQVAHEYATPQVSVSVSAEHGKELAHISAPGLDPDLKLMIGEELPTGGFAPIAETDKPDATVPFTPGLAQGGPRNLSAQVILPDGSVGDTVPAGSYLAPPPAKAGRPGKLKIKRHGTSLRVTFNAGANAKGYQVIAKVAHSGTVMAEANHGSHGVKLPMIPRGRRVKVTVTPYAVLSGAGRPRSKVYVDRRRTRVRKHAGRHCPPPGTAGSALCRRRR